MKTSSYQAYTKMNSFDYSIYLHIFQYLSGLDVLNFEKAISVNHEFPELNAAAQRIYRKCFKNYQMFYDKSELKISDVENFLSGVGDHIVELSIRYGYGVARTEKMNRNHELNRCLEMYCTNLKKLWLRKGSDKSLIELPRIPELNLLGLHRFQITDNDLSRYLTTTYRCLDTLILENMFTIEGDFLMNLISSNVSTLALKLKNLQTEKLQHYFHVQQNLKHFELNRFDPFFKLVPATWEDLHNLESISITSELTNDRADFRKMLITLKQLQQLHITVFYEHNINDIL